MTGESWLLRAALAGDPQAATLVGNLYVQSGPLPPNYAEASNWYRRAAEAGDKVAVRALGSLYLTGAGLARDNEEAARWLRTAAEAGRAQVDLANLALEGARERGILRDLFAGAGVLGPRAIAYNRANTGPIPSAVPWNVSIGNAHARGREDARHRPRCYCVAATRRQGVGFGGSSSAAGGLNTAPSGPRHHGSRC